MVLYLLGPSLSLAEASERLQQFLKVDRQNTRLEAKADFSNT